MAKKPAVFTEESPADRAHDAKMAGKKGAPKEGSAAEERMDAMMGQKTTKAPGKPAGKPKPKSKSRK